MSTPLRAAKASEQLAGGYSPDYEDLMLALD